MGLRFNPEFIDKLFSREEVMRESTTYQAVMAAEREKGLTQGLTQGLTPGQSLEARRLLLRMGQTRWGIPDAAIRSHHGPRST